GGVSSALRGTQGSCVFDSALFLRWGRRCGRGHYSRGLSEADDRDFTISEPLGILNLAASHRHKCMSRPEAGITPAFIAGKAARTETAGSPDVSGRQIRSKRNRSVGA